VSRGVRTYHIEDSTCIDPGAGTIRHQPVGASSEATDRDWMQGVASLGLTAGASTPNNKIGQTVARICETVGLAPQLDAVVAAA
jgi:4-hydroxy-3-methylbut-2-enyl diphosphate reductase